MNPTQQEVHDVFAELYQSLTDAYWVASTITDKDRLRGTADSVFDILTALNQAEIKSRTQEYATLKDQVGVVTKKLTALQKDIDSIIHNVNVAASVVQAIGKAMAFGGNRRCWYDKKKTALPQNEHAGVQCLCVLITG
jgi:ABC-type transporter Mla subunit MlaD